MDRSRKIEYLSLFILAGFFIGILFYYIFPNNPFLFIPQDRFNDFFNVLVWNQYLPSDPSPNRSYFPFTYIIINVFNLIRPEILSLLLFIILFFYFFIKFSLKNISTDSKVADFKNVFIFSFFSYPVLFLIDRANFESFVFIFLALFIYFYQNKKFLISALLLSLAISMKLFPAVFIILFLSDKKYKEAVYTVIFTVIITIISLLFLSGSLTDNIQRMLLNMKLFNLVYVIQGLGFDYGHSLFSVFKILNYLTRMNPNIEKLLTPYFIFVILFFAFLTVYIIFYETEFWKKVTILTISMCLFPYVSSNYKLIHFFIPLYLYINIGKKEKYDILYVILFSLLLIPKNLRFIIKYDFYSGVLIDPLIMLILLFVIINSFSKANANKLKSLFIKNYGSAA
ncbi:MAG: glycosyltransferase 87 family protein [Smithella sp.]